MNTNHDWKKSRENYSQQELQDMIGWIDKQKELAKESNEIEENQLPDVNPEHLNRLQRFTYNLVEEFKSKNKQLLMIILGTAGKGKSFTVASLTKHYLGLLKRACPTAKAAFLKNGKK